MHVIPAVLLFLSASGVRASEPVPLENFSGRASELGEAASASEILFAVNQDLAFMPPETRPSRLFQPLPQGVLMNLTLTSVMPGAAAALSLIPPKAVSPAGNAARFYGERLVGAPSARGELSRISVGPGAAGAFMDGMSLQDIKDRATHIAVQGGEFVAYAPEGAQAGSGQFYRIQPELPFNAVTPLRAPHFYKLLGDGIHLQTTRGLVGLPTFRKQEDGSFSAMRTQPSQPVVSAAMAVQDLKSLSEAIKRLSALMEAGLLMEAYRLAKLYLEKLEAAGDVGVRDEWKRRMDLLFGEIVVRSERLSDRFNAPALPLIQSPITFRDKR